MTVYFSPSTVPRILPSSVLNVKSNSFVSPQEKQARLSEAVTETFYCHLNGYFKVNPHTEIENVVSSMFVSSVLVVSVSEPLFSAFSFLLQAVIVNSMTNASIIVKNRFNIILLPTEV